MKNFTFLRTKYVLIMLVLFNANMLLSQTPIANYNFNTDNEGWTFSSNAGRNTTASWNCQGDGSIYVRGGARTATSPNINLSAYDRVDISFCFKANDNVGNNDGFDLQYDNGSGIWQIIKVYRRSNDFSIGSGNSITFTYSLTSPNLPTNARFRFISRGSSNNNRYYYFDNIQITGYTRPAITAAPGGINNHLKLWLKGNEGLSYSDGNRVDVWEDQGYGSNATAVRSQQRPTYRNNPSKNVNFNPVVEFDNTFSSFTKDSDYSYDNVNTQFLQGIGSLYTQDMFVVIIPDDTVINSSFGFMDLFCGDADISTNAEDATGLGMGDFTGRVSGESICFSLNTYSTSIPGDGYAVYDQNTTYNNAGIINARNNPAVTQQQLFYNANNIEFAQNDIPKFMNVNDSRYWIGRSEGWEASLNARIAEVITYSSRKSDTDLTQERNRIQSYLAVKYGITLGVNGTSQDYVNSDGTVIWDVNTGVPANDVFNYDIAGIGRDDASELYQKQSRSVNNAADGTGRTQGVLTMGITDLYDTNSQNPHTLENKQFLMWGNNGVPLNNPAVVVDVNMSADIPGLESWVQFNGIARTWKVVENGGDFPTVKVAMLRSAIRTAAPPNGRYLMFISDTPNFDPTADYRVMTEELNELGENVVTTHYDFDGTKYITFGWAPERVYERSISFNGINNYIDMEDALNLNTTGFTVSAWIKRDVNSVNKSILSKRDTDYNASNSGYDFRITNTGHFNVRWKNSSGVSQELTSSVPIPINVWHNIAVIYNGTTATLYIDGVADTSSALSAPASSTHSFLVGAAGKGTITDFFHGGIDEVRVWNTALTVDQLRFVMNQEIQQNSGFVRGAFFQSLGINPTKNDIASVPWNQLAAYYPMTTYTYTNTKDESGNGNQGALRALRTVDRQTAPLPYISNADGNWTSNSTWVNGNVQTIPGAPSIVNPSQTIDWNIIETNHNIMIDKDNVLGRRVTTLGLLINSNTLTVDGQMADGGTGNALTVTHYLNLDGKIDLQGESQLIQTLGSDLDPTSSGELDRDQQGTRDQFTYNYWAAPVGTKNTTTNNNSYTLPTVLRDGTDPNNPQNITFLSSGYNGNTNPLRIANYWIWKFANQPDDDYSAWQHVRSTGAIHAGEGYTMKGVANTFGNISQEQNYVFTGKPNNGDINLTLNGGNDYLVGNPYASAIDAVRFILDNSNTIDGTLYFWEHWGGGSHNLADYQGGYAQINLSGSIPVASYGTNDPDVGTGGTPTKLPGRYIAVGQGFFVVADSDGGTINFNNGQRAYAKESSGNSVFMRTSMVSRESNNSTMTSEEAMDPRMKFRIGFYSVNTIHRQLLLTIDENATEGLDWGYDGKLYEEQMDDMYWMIENTKLNIQGRNVVHPGTIVPLGIHTADAGQNTIKIDALENVPDSINIYAHDKVLDIYHDLRQSGYTFTLPAGEYLDRFEITFSNSVLSLEDNNINTINTFFNNNNESIVLLNPELKNVKTIELFNILGQSIATFDEISPSANSEYKVKNLSAGTYIIKVYTDNGSFSKKVLVE